MTARTDMLIDGPDDAPVTLLLAHGAGAPMDSAGMTGITEALVQGGVRRRGSRLRITADVDLI